MKQGLKTVGAIVGIAVLVLLIMNFNDRITEMTRLEQVRDDIAVDVTSLAATEMVLQTQVAQATQQNDPRQPAYESKYIEEGDILVVPVPAGDAEPTPQPAPTPAPQTYEEWEYWYALFFGEP